MNTFSAVAALGSLVVILAACAQPNVNQATTQRSQAGVLLTQPSGGAGGGGAGGGGGGAGGY